MILLDTNVLSAMMQTQPDLAVAKWLDAQPRDSIWITSVTLMEIRVGLHTMPLGRRRHGLVKAFGILLDDKIEGRVAPFDAAAAEQAAEVMVRRRARGRPVDFRDTMIAGIALAARATLVTRNISQFQDLSVPVVDPWVIQK